MLLLARLLVFQMMMMLGLSAAMVQEASSAAQLINALPGCEDACGNVSIPYPFGIGEGCFLEEGFNITCNASTDPPKPFLGESNIEVREIQLSQGLVEINVYMAYDCYSKDGKYNDKRIPYATLGDWPYRFSDSNKFIAVGCDTIGHIYDANSGFETGCLSVCNDSSLIPSGTCSGIGCCEVSIPKGLRYFEIRIHSYANHSDCWDFNPCSYAFLTSAQGYWFNFSLDSFSSLANETKSPAMLEWAIYNHTCEEAPSNLTSYACKSDNSVCLSSSAYEPGYRCNCSKGFQGNPYLQGGCQDIDECAAVAPNNPCSGTCTNTPGGYYCSCPRGMYGDGKVDGSGCKSMRLLLYVILGVGFGLLLLIISSSWLYWIYRKNKLIELKKKFFRQNGGYLLQQQSSSSEGMGHATKLFTAKELEKATNNFDENRILGRGGFGTVYKGILIDKSIVAIKKSRLTEGGSQSEIEQFINEVVILSQINHRNVVKLLGCCLETRVPMLVYEFVSNGTLSHHIHDDNHTSSLSLANRLRIATETAGALAYLHSAASMPIIHRDVKSMNILLDDNLTAKVSDFGASRFVPFDRNGLTSLVRGTLGYLDPEYFHTSQFTDRSDVYSFGVVLVEILTGKSPIIVNSSSEKQNLAMHFVSYFKENKLFELLEDRVINEGSQELLVAVAELARRCLRLMGEERPTMKEVAMELERLARMGMHPWVRENVEENESLLGKAGFFGADSMFAARDSSTYVVPLNVTR